MSDPETWSLTVTNLLLGMVIVIVLLGLIWSLAAEDRERRRRESAEADLDREFHDLFYPPDAEKTNTTIRRIR